MPDNDPIYVKKESKPKLLQKRAEGFNEDGYWAGEGNAASGVLPICVSTGRVCLAWRSEYVQHGSCWGTIGGAVKDGLTPAKSAETELREETGYHGSLKLHPAYVFVDGKFKYHNFIAEVAEEFAFHPEDDCAWETDTIEWSSLPDLHADMKTHSGDYHPGLLTLFKQSAELIERIARKAQRKKATPVAEETEKVTDSPEFQRWFAGSKVVDAQGQPLRVYKGMYAYDWTKEKPRGWKDPVQYRSGEPVNTIKRVEPFPTFDKEDPEGVQIAGFFSADPEVAERFAPKHHGAIFPCYLALKHPFIIDAKGDRASTAQFGPSGKPFREAIRSGLYDGVIIKNTSDEGDIYVALQPNQIKSAIGNAGTFHPDDHRLTASKSAAWATTMTPAESNALREMEKRSGGEFKDWLEEYIGDDEDPTFEEVWASSDMRLDYFRDWLRDEHQIDVSENGECSFWKLTPEVERLIGDLPVLLFHHTSTFALPEIKKDGLHGNGPKSNPYLNSGSGVYLTTEASGPAVDGYLRNAIYNHRDEQERQRRKHKGKTPRHLMDDPREVTLQIRTHLRDLAPDPDDEDIQSGETQFVVPYVPPQDIIFPKRGKTADRASYEFGRDHGLAGFPGNVPNFQRRLDSGKELDSDDQDYMRGHKDGTEEAARRAETGEYKCPECAGTGIGAWHKTCSECEGTGSISAEQANTVDVLHHLTDDPNFKADPNFVPEDNALSINQRSRPGLFAARPEDVSTWVDQHGYDRPYVAEIHVPRFAHEPGRWGRERFIPAEHLDKAKVTRVTPRRQNAIGEKTAAKAKQWGSWIGVDLDGTFAQEIPGNDYSDPTLIGLPIDVMVEKVKRAIEEGYTVKVFTARMADLENAEKIANAIGDWTEKYVGTRLDATCEKDPGCLIIIDDKARQAIPGTGEVVTKRAAGEQSLHPVDIDSLPKSTKEDIVHMLSETHPFFQGSEYTEQDISDNLFGLVDSPQVLTGSLPVEEVYATCSRKPSEVAVKKYLSMLRDPSFEFDPILTVDGKFFDGGHRMEAYHRAGRQTIPVVEIGNLIHATNEAWGRWMEGEGESASAFPIRKAAGTDKTPPGSEDTVYPEESNGWSLFPDRREGANEQIDINDINDILNVVNPNDLV